MSTFSAYCKDHLLYLDGGMGTMLQKEGMRQGELSESWNLSHPDAVTRVHTAYFNAGSNLVATNTFGVNTLKYSEDEAKALITAAFENAKTARENSTANGEKFIALDIGPLGTLLKPLGTLCFEDAVQHFAFAVKCGVMCGADAILIETMGDLYETKAALLAAKENASLPVLVSNAFGADGKLMTGADAAAVVTTLEGLGADMIGVNCSFGPETLAKVVESYLASASVPVLFKPNAGLPKVEDGKTVYDVSPSQFASAVAPLVRKGVRAVGGCCGTTPAYIAALVDATRDIPVIDVEKKHLTRVASYTHAVTFGKEPVIVGERINPTGKKRFKQALAEHDIPFILSVGIAEQEQGADVLDVNVGLPEIDEPEMLTEVVSALQSVTALPLQIDTADTTAMARALRVYNGKALVNSVNGKKESMDAVFPLVKKYGGVCVALTLDENGIPTTADGRVEIAKRILETAARYGLTKDDLLFDTLTMTVSADKNAALATLDALRTLKQMGCHTMLGVSNISFGLPARDNVSGAFYLLALENGLDAAILNPASVEMRKAYTTYRLLKGMDENAVGYMEFAATLPTSDAVQTNAVKAPADKDVSTLAGAIRHGLKDAAGQMTLSLLAETEPLTLISEQIIPALNEVGAAYEKGTAFLPQLLMSAEAAGKAFDVIKSAFPKQSGADKGKFVLATVKGDIHDIGKNIVRLLLENYGFEVIDLGRDVPPEKVAEAVKKHDAPLVGLSALMTTTVPAMEETIRLLRSETPRVKIIVGGAVMTEEYAAKIGADKYGADAMDTVKYALSVAAAE